MTQYTGKCIGGPYNGREHIYHEKIMPVVFVENGFYGEIPFKREGAYKFKNGVWLWCGPTYQEARLKGK